MLEIHLATAVYVFDPGFTRLLFIRHRKPPLAGFWLPPGGHVDPGERPDEAALREVFEETGLRVRLLDPGPDGPARLSPRVFRPVAPLWVQEEDLGDHRHLDFVFVAVAEGEGPLVCEPDQPARWFAPDETQAPDVLEDCRGHARHVLARAAQLRAAAAGTQ